MIEMWAKRYIAIAKKDGNKNAMTWANTYIPEAATPAVKVVVEKLLGIVRPPTDDKKPA